MKTYRIIYGISTALILVGAVMHVWHINIGISGMTLVVITLVLTTTYQNSFIYKLYSQLGQGVKPDSEML